MNYFVDFKFKCKDLSQKHPFNESSGTYWNKVQKKRTFVGCLLQNKSAELCKEKMQRTALY